MIEEFIVTMPLWQKMLSYTFILAGLYIFVKTGKLRIMGRQMIPMKWRIALSLFFPVIFVLGLFFGAFFLGAIISFILLATLIGIFKGKKPKLPKLPRVKINIITKNN
tara:strand:+ start:423 stop:746 length:324 start_codon:yes stop_codon:yes gene_type:complete